MNAAKILLLSATSLLTLVAACSDEAVTRNASSGGGGGGGGTDTGSDLGGSGDAGDDNDGSGGGTVDTGSEPASVFYVVLVSRTTNDVDLGTTSPGPDIDAVELWRGGEMAGSGFVAAGNTGGQSLGADLTTNDTLAAANGPSDAWDDTGACDLAEDPNARFVSFGDTAGFAIFEFHDGASTERIALEPGDVIKVYELAAGECSNVSTARDDAYEVFMADADVDPSNVTSAADIVSSDQFTSLGTASGGKQEFTYGEVD